MLPGPEAGDFVGLIVLYDLRAFPESFQLNAVLKRYLFYFLLFVTKNSWLQFNLVTQWSNKLQADKQRSLSYIGFGY